MLDRDPERHMPLMAVQYGSVNDLAGTGFNSALDSTQDLYMQHKGGNIGRESR